MKLKINQEKFFSIFAVIISLLTLVSLVYQNRLISKNQKAAVLPYLEIYDEAQGTNNYRLVLENKGTGPAMIKKLTYSANGFSYEGGMNEFLFNEKDSVVLPKMYMTYSDIFLGGLISAGERVELIVPMDSLSISNLENFIDNADFDFKILYSSIYDETWEASFKRTVPTEK